jgi:hypothetical protein
MVTTHQLERLRKDSVELSHYIHKLNKKGKTQLAFKVERKREYLDSYISDLTNSSQSI